MVKVKFIRFIKQLLILVIFGITFLHGASKVYSVNNDYLGQNWTIADGLTQNKITALLQTRNGYVWIGTPTGLNRFDGIRSRPRLHLRHCNSNLPASRWFS